MKTEMMKRGMSSLVLGSCLVFLSGCGPSFQAAGDIARGRQAMLAGDNQGALSYFQSAAQTDPNYVYGTELRENVLSYLGRAQYLTGDLTQARQTLERGLAKNRGDNIARLYLGLTLARQNDRQRGRNEIEAGMKGIRDFVNYIRSTFSTSFGQFWDPNQDIRKAIDSDLAMISRANFDWPTLISDGERIGKKIEEEPDLARQQEEQRQQEMDRRR
jgi:tetratricopeptide (TPR) repeat protein